MRRTDQEITAGLSRMLDGFFPQEYARKFSMDERRKLASEGKAMDDLTFPVVTTEDLSNAIGLARTPAQRSFIKKRAKALGASKSIPDTWAAQDPSDQRVTKAIEAAISAQEADLEDDPDPQDRQVLGLLKQALGVQRTDQS